jgi:N-glycosylase/DNA lyase
MKIKYIKNKDGIILKSNDFNLSQTLNCGQCFRFFNLEKHKFIIIAKNKVLEIEQLDDDEIFFKNCNMFDFENIWLSYFDLERDYSKIKNKLSQDKFLKKTIDFAPGIRILKQDFFETLISFIISQNNRITRIKKIVENISKIYGKNIKNNFFSFPEHKDLIDITEDDLRKLKVGFRTKYILDAIYKFDSLKDIKLLKTKNIKEKLTNIYGVGDKISDCILLFSFSKYDSFPIDVWIKKAMEINYFNKISTCNIEIKKFAIKKFKNLAGFAQQYIYNYMINSKI